MFHFVWGCPRFTDPSYEFEDFGGHIRGSRASRAYAHEEAERWPVFWLRGLVPKPWYEEVLQDHWPQADSYEVCEWGLFAEQTVVELPVDAVTATDASGGKYSADPRLRRIKGAGVVILSKDFVLLGLLCCSVPGEQAVNRGELFAMVLAAYRTSGDNIAATDSAYVQKPCVIGEGAQQQTRHIYLWALLSAATVERQGRLKICKVASHEHRDFIEGGSSSSVVVRQSPG